jgi:hypothetical protein
LAPGKQRYIVEKLGYQGVSDELHDRVEGGSKDNIYTRREREEGLAKWIMKDAMPLSKMLRVSYSL